MNQKTFVASKIVSYYNYWWYLNKYVRKMWRNILKYKTKYDHIVQKTPPHNLIINHLYSPTIIVAGIAIGTPIAAQISFGLSIGAIAASPSAMISATCTQDWIEVNTNFLLFNQGTMDTQ